MKRAVFTCPFVPPEWVAAHGFRPSRVVKHVQSSFTKEGLCPYARAAMLQAGSACDSDVFIFTTACDQMRRVTELIDAPVFLLNVPTTQTASAKELYKSELKRLARFLIDSGGTKPITLVDHMRDFDAKRSAIRDMREHLSSLTFSETLANFHEHGIVIEEPASKHDGLRLAILGGPIMRHELDIFDEIEKSGGRIVLDATTNGERTLPAPFDFDWASNDPFDALVDAYWNIPDAFRRPNVKLYDWLAKEMQNRRVEAVIFRHYVWCDIWHGEAQRFKEWAQVPVLIMDVADGSLMQSRDISRIQSFLEMLQ